jgi:enoyl-CoA hydratase
MRYELLDNIALITIDDGKANAVGHALLDFTNESLDRATADGAGAVILQGREGLFSAGFDLKEFEKGMEAGLSMVSRGFELLIRLYGLPQPLIAACTGHGVAMGAFILLACDTRIGARGDFRITLPETRINMELPYLLQALCADRLSPNYMTQAVVQSQVFSPEEAVKAGFLDRVVAPEELQDAAMTTASELAQLPQKYYGANKRFMREQTLSRMQLELDKMRAAATQHSA